MSRQSELAELGRIYNDGALSNRNAVINGEFSVSQRGDYTSATVMTDNAYTLDRWKTYKGGGTATFQDMGGSLKLTATSAYTGTLSIRQHVEWLNLKTRVGQTFTLSTYMKTTSSNARVLIYDGTGWTTGATAHSGSGQWELVTLTFTMPNASSYGSILVAVGIDGINSANVSISNGENVEIKQVQLEVGDTATPFEHEPYSVTLQKCQRYFYKFWHDNSANGPALSMIGAYWNATEHYCSLPLTTPMRAKPSLSYSDLQALRVFGSGTSNSCSNIGIDAFGVTSLELNVSSSNTAASAFVRINDSDDWLALDAEL